MKNLMTIIFIILLFSNCDPVSQMEADIDNLTTQHLSIVFVSSDKSLNKTLLITPGQAVLFQEGFNIGSTYLEPSLIEYDSVYIKNRSEKILKVYKQNSDGKNIYNITDFWQSSEPSKRFFKYNFEITNVDIE